MTTMEEEVKQEEQAPADPAEEAANEQLDETAAKANEYLAGWQRAQADYANLKKDVERMREEMAKYACAGLIEKLMPVMDGFAKAAAHAPETADEKVIQWTQGIGHVQVQLEKVLADAGLAIIDDANVPFDPMVHEAMLREHREGAPPDTVIEILEPGYMIHDRVIRPAKVKVAE